MSGSALLQEVYDASYGRLVLQIFALCGNASDAEDAVQEAFMKAIGQGRAFEPVLNPEAWLRTAALNHQRNSWRHARVVRRVVTEVPGPQSTPELGPAGPSPSPSVTFESPGRRYHPITMYAAHDALTLLTAERMDRPGPATLWRKAPGGWLRLGTLEGTVGPDAVAEQIRLQAGPGSDDLVAFGLSGNRVGFSQDGGATWSHLAPPAGCPGEDWCSIDSTGDWLYIADQGAAWRAPFGARAWERFSVPQDDPVLLELDDTLISIESDCDNATNHYWVSHDECHTWKPVLP